MSDGINYEIRISTSYSRDGHLIKFVRNPQKGTVKKEIIRKLTKKEILKSNKIRKQYGKEPLFNNSVLMGVGYYG